MKVSVIVGVYNGERYLRESIDSMLAQTLRDVELIFVDDGSTDSTPEILKEYQRKDGRVKILTQENLYCGTARNYGLSVAAGEYVIFWDCDDLFAPEMLELMVMAADQADAEICICDAQDFDNETGKKLAHNYLKKPLPDTDVFTPRELGDRVFLMTAPVAWNKLIRRELLERENLRFQTIPNMEDVSTTYMAIACAKRITLVKKKLVQYRTNSNTSAIGRISGMYETVFEAYECLWDRLKARGMDQNEAMVKSFRNKALEIYFFMMRYLDRESFSAYYRELKTHRLAAVGIDRLTPEEIPGDLTRERFELLMKADETEYLLEQFKGAENRLALAKQDCEKLKKDRKKYKKKNEELQQQAETLTFEKTSLLSGMEEQRKELEAVQRKAELLAEEKQKLEQRLKEMEESMSYRTGKALMWLPGKLRRMFS